MPNNSDPQWLRNGGVAKYFGVTKMTLWRWQQNPQLNFPKPSLINGIAYTRIDEIEKWMKTRVVKRIDHAA
ncbi:putative DNA-binding transcriptional regulator AlpA [Bradyrhizobium diazoefficiens]